MRRIFGSATGLVEKLSSHSASCLMLALLAALALVYAEFVVLRLFVEHDILIHIEDAVIQKALIIRPHILVEKTLFFVFLVFIILSFLLRGRPDFPRFSFRFSWPVFLYQFSCAMLYLAFLIFATRRAALWLDPGTRIMGWLGWFAIEGLMVAAAFPVFTDLRPLPSLVMSHKKEAAVSVAFSFIFIALSVYRLVQLVWKPLSFSIGKFLSFFLRLTYGNSSFDPATMHLNIRDFGVTIGGRCAGVEGMTLFTVLFFALLIIDWQKLSKWRALLLFPLGILMMYFANIFRIYLILVLGYEVSVRMGREAAYHLILEHFHSNIGWILYTALILLFFWLALPFLARRARTP